MDKQVKRMLLLFSLILVVIPMVIFPGRLGMPLVGSSAVVIYELVYYAAVLYLMRRQSTLAAVFVGAALTLVYRLALGAALGISIIVMYGLDGSAAFSLGMTKYLPALLLQAAAAPFVIRPIYFALAEKLAASENVTAEDRPALHSSHAPATTGAVVNRESTAFLSPRTEDKPRPAAGPRPRLDIRGAAAERTGEENQFERAVAYIGESGAVKLALLVDDEGLPLARFSRCEEDPDLWAPLAIILDGQNRHLLSRYRGGGFPEKIDVSTGAERIILRRIEHVALIVLTEHNADETIHIRIAQAADMVRKYMSERYSPALFARVEEHYVSHS